MIAYILLGIIWVLMSQCVEVNEGVDFVCSFLRLCGVKRLRVAMEVKSECGYSVAKFVVFEGRWEYGCDGLINDGFALDSGSRRSPEPTSLCGLSNDACGR
jgi:hypothetical protein